MGCSSIWWFCVLWSSSLEELVSTCWIQELMELFGSIAERGRLSRATCSIHGHVFILLHEAAACHARTGCKSMASSKWYTYGLIVSVMAGLSGDNVVLLVYASTQFNNTTRHFPYASSVSQRRVAVSAVLGLCAQNLFSQSHTLLSLGPRCRAKAVEKLFHFQDCGLSCRPARNVSAKAVRSSAMPGRKGIFILS